MPSTVTVGVKAKVAPAVPSYSASRNDFSIDFNWPVALSTTRNKKLSAPFSSTGVDAADVSPTMFELTLDCLSPFVASAAIRAVSSVEIAVAFVETFVLVVPNEVVKLLTAAIRADSSADTAAILAVSSEEIALAFVAMLDVSVTSAAL